jgi:hypothetical protein
VTGAKWASLSDKDRKPFVEDAARLKEKALKVLGVKKESMKAEKKAVKDRLPTDWKAVEGTETSRPYFTNGDLVAFSRPYLNADLPLHLAKKEKKKTGAKGKKSIPKF